MTVVDRDALLEEATQLARSVSEWFVEREIVKPAIGKEGFPPGAAYKSIVDLPTALRVGNDNQRQGDQDSFLELTDLTDNTFQVQIGRGVYDSGQGEVFLICKNCRERFRWTEEWQDAIGQWAANLGEGLLSCPFCNYVEPVTEWQHDPSWGFGNLAFTFWNWPMLKQSFVQDIGRLLGHRVILVYGKI